MRPAGSCQQRPEPAAPGCAPRRVAVLPCPVSVWLVSVCTAGAGSPWLCWEPLAVLGPLAAGAQLGVNVALRTASCRRLASPVGRQRFASRTHVYGRVYCLGSVLGLP